MNRAANPRIMRFGPFEANLETGELRKGGIRLKMQDQPFQILTLLLERPGEIVTREEIADRLWQGATFVDLDQSIGAAVNKLRRSLGDSAGTPRYIETLRMKGFRLLVPVQLTDVPVAAESEVEAVGVGQGTFWSRRRLLAAALLLAVAVAAAGKIWIDSRATAAGAPNAGRASVFHHWRGRREPSIGVGDP